MNPEHNTSYDCFSHPVLLVDQSNACKITAQTLFNKGYYVTTIPTLEELFLYIEDLLVSISEDDMIETPIIVIKSTSKGKLKLQNTVALMRDIFTDIKMVLLSDEHIHTRDFDLTLNETIVADKLCYHLRTLSPLVF
ncbi:hypothetical protein AKO1_008311 [Acrasis kona]|uniref:Uncharacterized protein n=1 Tax=Acrasis kona TaxID=1008807 RepID=A0AAW2YP39_9EUKA